MDAPREGDYLVLYPDDPLPFARIELLRVQTDNSRYLVRATFASSPGAGARFEELAVTLAQAAKARAFRGMSGGDVFIVLHE